MAVLMTGKVPGMTAEIYDGIATNAMPRLKQAKGFISHAAGMGDDGVWTVLEVWESEEDSPPLIRRECDTESSGRRGPRSAVPDTAQLRDEVSPNRRRR
jgi:hypothetical protein